MEGVVLYRVDILGLSFVPRGPGFETLGRHPYTQTWVKYPPPPRGRSVYTIAV